MDRIDQILLPPVWKTGFSTLRWIWHAKNDLVILQKFWELWYPPPFWENPQKIPFFWTAHLIVRREQLYSAWLNAGQDRVRTLISHQQAVRKNMPLYWILLLSTNICKSRFDFDIYLTIQSFRYNRTLISGVSRTCHHMRCWYGTRTPSDTQACAAAGAIKLYSETKKTQLFPAKIPARSSLHMYRGLGEKVFLCMAKRQLDAYCAYTRTRSKSFLNVLQEVLC